jgi:polar amino acid transport system substrate-binding protein
MFRLVLALFALALLASCASAPSVPPAARSDLAPTGTLRVGTNFGNVLLTGKDAATGEPRGIAIDLAREIGRRLGVPVEFVAYDAAGKLTASTRTGAWDIAFLGAEPQRADEIAFTAAYLEIEATYLVPAGSKIGAIGEVDRDGARIAVPVGSAYDLYLSRNIKRAQLVRAAGADAAFDLFVRDRMEVLAGLKARLVNDAARLPGSKLLAGRFTAVQQAIGTHRGRDAGAQYLREFVEDAKASGLVARIIEKNGVHGVSVAPSAAVRP